MEVDGRQPDDLGPSVARKITVIERGIVADRHERRR